MNLSYVIILRLVLAPVLVAAATSAGYRFGPKVTGWIVGFPVVAGPILLLFTIEQGPEFAAKAAESSVLGVVSLVAFCVAYLVVARSYSWPVSVLCGWICFSCCTFLLQKVHIPWWVSTLVAFCAVESARRSLPRPLTPLLPRTFMPWDIPIRMATTAALVVALTEAAAGLGSQLSGLLTPFPIVTSVIAVFAQRNQGYAGAFRTLQGLLGSMPAYIAFCLVVALVLVPLGVWAAFICALSANLILLLLALARMRTQRR